MIKLGLTQYQSPLEVVYDLKAGVDKGYYDHLSDDKFQERKRLNKNTKRKMKRGKL